MLSPVMARPGRSAVVVPALVGALINRLCEQNRDASAEEIEEAYAALVAYAQLPGVWVS